MSSSYTCNEIDECTIVDVPKCCSFLDDRNNIDVYVSTIYALTLVSFILECTVLLVSFIGIFISFKQSENDNARAVVSRIFASVNCFCMILGIAIDIATIVSIADSGVIEHFGDQISLNCYTRDGERLVSYVNIIC